MIEDTTGKLWMSVESMFRYYAAEGFVVGSSKCLDCGFVQHAVVDPRTRLDVLQCIRCKGTSSVFTSAVLPPPEHDALS